MRNLHAKRQRWLKMRIAFLGVLLIAASTAVVRRAWHLQIEKGATFRQMVRNQYLRSVHLAPRRGTIYDRHGAELAVSVDADSVWANPRVLQRDPTRLAGAAMHLGRIFEVSTEQMLDKLSAQKHFVWIKRKATPQQAALVKGLQVEGVFVTPEPKRFYPNRELGAHVLGFANVDGVGIEGVELTFEQYLAGKPGAIPAIVDSRGELVFSEQLIDDRATRGNDVVLTLDKTLQYIAERELENAIQSFRAKAGSILVLEPHTGEILAIASYPTFNPNDPASSAVPNRRNRAVTDRFEPGSTLKPFAVAGALEAKTIGVYQPIDCENGRMRFDKYFIHDTKRYSILTPAQILAKSSNIGAAKIGATLGRRGLYETLQSYGFGQKTGVPLPGEVEGTLRHYSRWYEMDVATVSFGQGVSVTAVQLALAMATFANGGKLMEPVLVRKVINSRGETVLEHSPRVRRHVVPAEIARTMSQMLIGVTQPDGTGAEAAIEGYAVAGKTGTAQKADYVKGGYERDRWIASFTGFVPAHRPKLVVSVVVDEPTVEHLGGVVAGSVFRKVGAASLRRMGVPTLRSTTLAALGTPSGAAGVRAPRNVMGSHSPRRGAR